ncbi:NAD(P)H-binding protein [Spirillospora sp. NPDC047279]|uniref:SDR family oxidoreductase n=1 Tax=Spirillospora sp. NPDC047279 TaxID=3155478 RepID=UPI003404C938
MFVVTGATGNVGRPLVQALAEASEKVTAVSRRPAPGAVPEGVRHVAADLTDPESMRPALDGAEVLFLLVAAEGLEPDGVLDVVKSSGVRRIVMLSSQGAGTRPANPSHAPLRVFEDAVKQTGLAWTILRPGGFASNAYWWAEPIREHRTVVAPFGDVGLPLVDPADIAAVAATVMRDGTHAGRTYVLTGPEPVTPREQARAIAGALGEGVEFVEQTRAEARAAMSRFMPEVVVDGTLEILGEPTEAERRVSPDVPAVLGRPAGTFAEWAGRNAAAFK